MDGQMMLLVANTLGNAIDEAQAEGFTAPDLGDAMRAECPSIMDQLNDFSEEQDRRDQLPGQMNVLDYQCTRSGQFATMEESGVTGTVRNGSTVRADIFLEADFLDSSGTVLDQGFTSVSSLGPGETARFEMSAFGSRASKCRVRVSDAFES